MINYWWVTRPKRKLNSIPEILAVFSTVSLDAQWQGSINLHRLFEDGLEKSGLKELVNEGMQEVAVEEHIMLG